jgi:two-component system NtrC family response regulator
VAQIQVLIIDDEADVCTFFRRLLTRRGYAVVTAVNQAEAHRALEEKNYNVALVDLKLPDTDGLTLLKMIKARQPACEVIIMTGYSTVKTAVTAIQLGCATTRCPRQPLPFPSECGHLPGSRFHRGG